MKKRATQQEIDRRTERLQNAAPALDRDRLLYRLLTNALPARRAPKKRPARVAKKTAKKK